MTIPGLSARPVKGGHVQVTPWATLLRRAEVVRWRSADADLVVTVRCMGRIGTRRRQ
ncbi:MAG: hypothetical protein AAF628_18580 [Planctomycetota bacterium]